VNLGPRNATAVCFDAVDREQGLAQSFYIRYLLRGNALFDRFNLLPLPLVDRIFARAHGVGYI